MNDKLKLALDIFFVRKYKKQIILANLAGVVVILCYHGIQDLREELKWRRTVKSLANEK